MQNHLELKDDAGPSAFHLLLRLLTTHFDNGDQGLAFEKLQAFGVPTGTVFSVYLRAYRELTSFVQGTEKICRPSDGMVLEIVRSSVSRQFPALTPVLYPGELMTAREPFESVSAMWLAHDVYATNNTPAINGEKYFSHTSSRGHTTFSSTPPSSASAQQTRSRNQTHQGTQRNPYVMTISAQKDADPFTMNYYHWPLEHFDEVYMVSTTFSTSHPPLWSPLLTASARADALRSYSGQCLNCGGRDHSMKTCRNHFINTTGVLNPGLGELNDGGHAFQQWQQRMLSYRRGQYERHVQQNSHRHSKRSNSRGQHSSGSSNNNRRHHSNSRGHRSDRNSDRTTGSQWSDHAANSQQGQGSSSQQLTPPSPQGPPSTALTLPNSATSNTSTPAHMRYGPTQTGGNNNSRQPGTFRTN